MAHGRLAGPGLVVQHTGQVCPLTRERTTIGHQADNTLILADRKVARHHATITWHDGVFVLRDLGSASGTYVNGQRIAEPQPLRHADTLRLGDTNIIVHLTPSAQVAPAPASRVSTLMPIILGIGAAGLLILCLAVATLLVQPLLRKDQATVIIQAPGEGARFSVGEEVIVQATAAGAGNLTRLELYVGETLVGIATSPETKGSPSLTARGPWIAGAEGRHVVSATAYTTNEESSGSASVEFTVVAVPSPPTPDTTPASPTPSPSSTPTQQPPPTDTPVPTSTPSPAPTSTDTPTNTPTLTPSPTRTLTPTLSATPTKLPPQIEYFRANPASIASGSCTSLEWGAVTNAIEAIIDQGIGGVGTPGSLEVCPTQATTYTMTATGLGGTTTASVSVTITGALPDLIVESISFVPNPPILGQENQVHITIHNIGDGDAGTFVWKWKPESAEKAARGTLENGLQAGQTTVETFVWRPTEASDNLLTVAQVDVRQAVVERDENNNKLEKYIAVADTALGDLVLQEFALDDEDKVIIQVANPGGRISAPNFEYELYENGALATMGSFDTPQSGSEVYGTGHVVRGVHRIRVVIDPAGLIPESDKTNNEGTLICSSDTHLCLQE